LNFPGIGKENYKDPEKGAYLGYRDSKKANMTEQE
jgi:hypothetical protein